MGVYVSYLTGINSIYDKFDTDKNQGLSRQESAQAALALKNSGDPIDSKIADVLATTVVGGKDGQGLFPDQNGDKLIQKQEFINLSNQAGEQP